MLQAAGPDAVRAAPAEASNLAPLRASAGSFPASYVAFVHDCPRAGRLHAVIF